MMETKHTFDEEKLQGFATEKMTKTVDEAIQALKRNNQWVRVTHDQIVNLEDLKSEIDLQKELVCLKCKYVPIDAVFCNSCEKFYCADCVDLIKLEAKESQSEEDKSDGPAVGADADYVCLNKKCKKCNFGTTKMTRMVRNMVDQFQFKFGDETMSFEKVVKKETEAARDKMRLKCPLCEKADLTKDELEAHIKDECANVQLKCMTCEIEYPRADFESHNCKKCLKEKIDKIVNDMEAQKKSLEKEFNEKK